MTQEIPITDVFVRQSCKSKGKNVKFSKFIGRFLVAYPVVFNNCFVVVVVVVLFLFFVLFCFVVFFVLVTKHLLQYGLASAYYQKCPLH